MARAGDELTFQGFEDRVVFLETSEETNGELLRYEATFKLRGILNREHVHPHQEERHELVSGRMAIEVDGSVKALDPGQAVVVPAGTPHALVPIDDGEVRLRVELRPALRWEAWFATAARLSRRRLRVWRGYVNPLLLALAASEYEPEIYVTRPPLAVQRVIFRPLAAIARARGYDKRYLDPGGGQPSASAGAGA